MSVDQPFNIYREQLSSQYHGLALWDPKPVKNLHKQPGHVSIGDVGYLDNGAFMRMFNVTLPWDDPSNKLIGKPEKYERIKPLAGDVRENEIREGEYYTTHVSKVDNIGANRHEDSIGQMYQCRAQHRGALLSLPHDGHRKDVIPIKVFEDYIRDNVDKWFRWSKKMKLPVENMEDLILVTGCTLVTSWAAAAFDGHMSMDSDATTISLETGKSNNGGAQYFWRNIRGSVEYHNSRVGPNVQGPLPQNQCVFIRGFRAKRTFFRTIPMRAAAEPLPDDPDDHREDEIQVTRIPDSSKYRDPLVGILDYIIQKCNEDISIAGDIVAIAHDDDLWLMEDVETLTADAIEEYLHGKQMPLLVVNGAAILHDPLDDEPPNSDEGNAAFSHSTSLLDRNSPAILRDPETNQMTAKRKEGGFLRQTRSRLSRRMTRARPSLLGTGNSPDVSKPLPPLPPVDDEPHRASVTSWLQGIRGKHPTVQGNRKIVTPSAPSSKPMRRRRSY